MSLILQKNLHRPSSLLLVGALLLCCWDLKYVVARHSGIVNRVISGSSHPVTLKLPFTISNLRGGSTAVADAEQVEAAAAAAVNESEEDAAGPDITQHPEFESLQAYRMKQQILLQLRATFLSEALARRGLPVPTLAEVVTPEGASPPQPVDWDCALATEENPKSCLFSFDAQPNTKVVAPLGSTDWIGLSTLNRLRRTDPTKVEPMWHMKYAVLDSWFGPESEYSLLQHVGVQGFLLNALLQGYRLQLALGGTLILASILFMPVLEYIANRFLVSGLLWSHWATWHRFVHAALPLKLFLGQIILKFFNDIFDKLVGFVKDQLVELENEILERSIPLTVGVPDMVPPSSASSSSSSSTSSDSELTLDNDEDEEEVLEELEEMSDEDQDE